MSSHVMVLSPICLGNLSYKNLFQLHKIHMVLKTIPGDVCVRVCEILVLNFNSQEKRVSYFHITKKWCG